MSNQVKRSAVNALVVELILERDQLRRDLSARWDAAYKDGQEITELRDTVDRQLKRIESLDDENWALKEELNLKREAARFNSNDRLKLRSSSWIKDIVDKWEADGKFKKWSAE